MPNKTPVNDTILNCFGDEETGNERDGQELIIIGDELMTQELLARRVDKIQLVGSSISGCHQELRFLLQSCSPEKSTSQEDRMETDFVARISRVNGSDTFQVAKSEDALRESIVMEDLPTLVELCTSHRSITLQDIKAAFNQARNLMKRYDQGDCHSLSQMICDALVPGSFPAEIDW